MSRAEYMRARRAANPQPNREAQARYRAANRAKIRAMRQTEYAKRNNRIPVWFGELDALAVEEAADLAVRRSKLTSEPWEIDHALPFKGRFVSGLHVWNNLSVVPVSVNQRKHNTWSPQ